MSTAAEMDLAVTMLVDAVANPSPAGARRVAGQLAHMLEEPGRVEECRRRAESGVADIDGGYLALIELVTSVQHLLAHPELIEGNRGSLADAHRADALRKSGGTAARLRIETAPDLFVVSHDSSRIAALAALMDDIPAPGGARVRVEAGEGRDEWVVHVVTHDRVALLARITDALRREHLNIVAADLATWPDGVVLDSFTVHSAAKPRELHLENMVTRHVRRFRPSWTVRIGGAGLEVGADNDMHPSNSLVTVTGEDREGILWRIATAFTRCGVQVHHARIETLDGRVNDRFEVTDSHGARLDDRTVARLARLLR